MRLLWRLCATPVHTFLFQGPSDLLGQEAQCSPLQPGTLASALCFLSLLAVLPPSPQAPDSHQVLTQDNTFNEIN